MTFTKKDMKKIFALSLLALSFACSTDKEGEQVCTNKLYNLTETCSTNPQTGEETCIRLATYGQTSASATTITVNEATYDHYITLGNVTDGSICWEGTK